MPKSLWLAAAIALATPATSHAQLQTYHPAPVNPMTIQPQQYRDPGPPTNRWEAPNAPTPPNLRTMMTPPEFVEPPDPVEPPRVRD